MGLLRGKLRVWWGCATIKPMKKDLHPAYFPTATATCACGNSFAVGSTKEKIEVEICSNCHPFYTGTERTLDAAGRVEKFRARRAAATPKKKSAK